MRFFLWLGCLTALGAAVLLGQAKAPAPDEASRAAVVKLFASLNDEQKKAALREFDDKDRYTEQFPGVNRPGVPFTKLTAEQKTLVADAVKTITSEYGAQRCMEIAKQDGDGQRYVTFFGTPTADGPFAWRFAQHHLTLVYAEFGKEKANEFGPILLGGNPAKSLWDEEEKLALELFAALSPEELKAIKAKGNSASGAPIDASAIKISSLGEKPRALAKKLLEQRLAVFSVDRRKVIEDMIQKDGGPEALRIAVWGEATKSHRDGGNYHWKIGGINVVCDWQTVGKDHIHMTLRGRVKS
ncbi:hypothetical protein AYO44_00575 [Planctomycetaceae bacterium SCGC AG-212-F19]|nr:hypothetical protein AYO44_00575 [Planctomycetaceae bacterium SCGC AG-212-F19]